MNDSKCLREGEVLGKADWRVTELNHEIQAEQEETGQATEMSCT